MDHSQEQNLTAIAPYRFGTVELFNDQTYDLIREFPIADFSVAENIYARRGAQVFFNSNGNKLYVLAVFIGDSKLAYTLSHIDLN